MKPLNDSIILIDTNSLMHRAYHAYPISLVNAQGEPVNAVYGVTSMLLDLLLKFTPKYVVCAFDSKAPTFRHKKYTGYKAKRPKTDSELTGQFKAIKEVISSLNIPIFEIEGYEADDIIGTLTKIIKNTPNKPKELFILTNDKDLYQLVDNYVTILAPYKRFQYLVKVNEDMVKKILGVTPSQVIDYKALVGDPSDNIPGVRGIGPKTAVMLLQKYGSLENIYKNLEKIAKENPSIYRKLADGYEEAKLSKELATIKRDLPIVFNLEDASLAEFDIQKAYKTFIHMQFKSLIPKINKLYTVITGKEPEYISDATKKVELEPLQVESKEEYSPKELTHKIYDLLEKVRSSKSTIWVYYNQRLYVAYLTKKLEQNWITYNIIGLFRDLITASENQTLSKVVSHIVNTLKTGVFDIQLGAYALITGRTSYSLEDLVTMYLDTTLDKEQLIEYTTNIALMQTKKLKELDKNFNKKSFELVTKIDPYTALAVSLMEKNGLCVDLNKVKEYNQILQEKLEEIEKKIHETVGFEFNVRSTKQLAHVLYEVLRLTPIKKRKTTYATDIDTLIQLRGTHPVIDYLIEYRKLQKIHSTYVKPFIEGKYIQTPIEPANSQMSMFDVSSNQNSEPCTKVHSTFNPLRTTTGRLASSNPNLQNLPLRTQEGAKVREFFVPAKGNIFISFDYSQIDLRVLAHTSQDENLIKAFIDKRDIHRETASKIFNKPYDKITDNERRVAKVINFGIVYGMSPYGLSQTLNIDYHQAEEFLKTYFEQFPKVKEYMQKIEDFVIEHGFVLSLFGRRRYIYGITSNNKNRRQAAFREAINMPIQGGSDDIIRTAIKKIFENDKDVQENRAKLVLQIHDELVFEVPKTEYFVRKWPQKIKKIMESVLKYPKEFSVPLVVEYKVEETL